MNPHRRNLFGLRPADLLPPRSSRDILRRTAVRLGFCSIPYLAVAAIVASFGDDRLLRGFGFWLCVVATPSAGLLIDLVRLWRVRNPGLKAPTA